MLKWDWLGGGRKISRRWWKVERENQKGGGTGVDEIEKRGGASQSSLEKLQSDKGRVQNKVRKEGGGGPTDKDLSSI